MPNVTQVHYKTYHITNEYKKHSIIIPFLYKQINFNSENLPGCSSFDIDIKSNNVVCLRAYFNEPPVNQTDLYLINDMPNKIFVPYLGPIISLEKNYTDGIPYEILFYFLRNI